MHSQNIARYTIVYYSCFMIVWLVWLIYPPDGVLRNEMIVVSSLNFLIAIFSITVACLEIRMKDTQLLHFVLVMMVLRNGMRCFDYENFM